MGTTVVNEQVYFMLQQLMFKQLLMQIILLDIKTTIEQIESCIYDYLKK